MPGMSVRTVQDVLGMAPVDVHLTLSSPYLVLALPAERPQDWD